ncbi:hypothetical protein AURDEDRAFT_174764 [Auricularia subglabra TFB-10046 SS5]|uniref:Uncharacterized protein n=1 Tax=Auricularia subglabra (strain TFB-10046 / SS5) TaxID=717982 RepID=J0D8Z0_AURST|nr:hypothetical protein AURDEDRAFT_174764 [Auricularia subglabra TFB-10046 SS5]
MSDTIKFDTRRCLHHSSIEPAFACAVRIRQIFYALWHAELNINLVLCGYTVEDILENKNDPWKYSTDRFSTSRYLHAHCSCLCVQDSTSGCPVLSSLRPSDSIRSVLTPFAAALSAAPYNPIRVLGEQPQRTFAPLYLPFFYSPPHLS